MPAWLQDYLFALSIVVVQCVIILILAYPLTRAYNEGDRARLFGHLDTTPPKGIFACRSDAYPGEEEAGTREFMLAGRARHVADETRVA